MINFLPVTFFGESSSSGIGALGFDSKAFLIQLVTFGLVFLVLKRYAFGPILKVLTERRETIEQGVKLGEQMQKEKAELEAKISKSLHEARANADKILADAKSQARQTIQGGEESARAKADSILAEARDAAKQEMTRARKQLESEVVGLISDATEVIIQEKVDAKKDATLIDRALKAQA